MVNLGWRITENNSTIVVEIDFSDNNMVTTVAVTIGNPTFHDVMETLDSYRNGEVDLNVTICTMLDNSYNLYDVG